MAKSNNTDSPRRRKDAKKEIIEIFGLITSRLRVFAVFIFSLLFLILAVQVAHAQESTEDYCLSCHGQPGTSYTLPSGESIPLTITPEMLAGSVHHAAGIECRACHTDITTYPHPPLAAQNARELTRTYYLACQKCHPGNYDKTLDSMHAQAAVSGNLEAPICTDCHGAHDVRDPDQPRALVSETCGKCHTAIFEEYKTSVHGAALLGDDNPDVPVCTDCHGVHNIQDPRTAQFRVASPELCAGCHANKELMDKYGLPSDVYNIYKLSWHGVEVSAYKANWPTIWHESAVCTDCHGVHNMLTASNPASSVSPENRLVTCQKCHPSAGPNWADAWTGHHPISLQRTPLLWYVKTFYDSFNIYVLWGLGIYVALQVLRAVLGAVKRGVS